jgi:predicted membrane channel-forming protein YqfA (hemolysin III family)
VFDPYDSDMIKGERFNSISHLVGVALALAGAVRGEFLTTHRSAAGSALQETQTRGIFL